MTKDTTKAFYEAEKEMPVYRGADGWHETIRESAEANSYSYRLPEQKDVRK